MPKKPLRAAIYARYSSDNQRQESIEAQVRIIKQYVENNNLNLVETYVDEAKSATTDQRPAFQKMIFDAENERFDIILVHKLDRFARDKYDSVYYKRKLKNLGIKLISVTEHLDGSPESVILESMLEGMAEYYSRNLSREVQKGMNQNAYKCLHTGGKSPFGYDVDPVTKEYRINQHEAIAIKKLFKHYSDGHSYRELIAWLNSHGYRTRFDNEFQPHTLHGMLRNEKYMGTYVFKKNSRTSYSNADTEVETIRIENGVPAIVSKELFLTVQARLKENLHNAQKYKASVPYLLSGRIYCGKCGGKMFGNRRKSGAKGKITYFSGYQCSTRKKLKACNMSEIKKEKIEDLLLDHLEKEVFVDSYINEISEKIYKSYLEVSKDANLNIKMLEDKLKKIEKQIENIVSAIMDGMNSSALKKKMDELELQKNEIVSTLLDESMKQNYNFTPEEIRNYFTLGRNITTRPLEEQLKIVETYIEKVVIYEEKVEVHLFLDKLLPVQRVLVGAGGGT
jgi:site-specific DNA recombinase